VHRSWRQIVTSRVAKSAQGMSFTEKSRDQMWPRNLGGRMLARWLWITLISLAAIGPAFATTTVEVLDTFPSGDTVTLNRNEVFYIRLHYSTDRPIEIWARPYFHGKPVNAGSNGSFWYTDSGEALAWFFLQPGSGAVDEIRVTAGDGSGSGTALVRSYSVQIEGSNVQGTVEGKPEWLTSLKARDAVRQREAYEARMKTPTSAGESAGIVTAVFGMLALGALGLIMPLRAMWRWRGGWRVAAVVPAALMGFVVLRLIIGTTIDPTSHNLWPFEMLMSGVLSVLIMVALTVMRKWAQARRA
jgi:hypothetical protein